MAQREPKSRTTTEIAVIGRTGGRKGRLEISSGNIRYYRSDAKEETGRWTLQQLLDLLEEDLEISAALQKPAKLPRNKQNGDFTIFVQDIDGTVVPEDEMIINASHALSKFDDERKFVHGIFQIDSPSKKPSFGFTWTAQIGINTAVYVVDLYISKWLKKKRGQWATDKNVTISRGEFSAIVRRWLGELRA